MKFGNVMRTTFILVSGIYVGNYLANIFVIVPIKAVDHVLADKLKKYFDDTKSSLNNDESEDNNND